MGHFMRAREGGYPDRGGPSRATSSRHAAYPLIATKANSSVHAERPQ